MNANGIFIGDSHQSIYDRFKRHMDTKFDIRDEGVPSYLLGMNLKYKNEEGELALNHSSYLSNVMKKFNVTDLPCSIPADPKIIMTIKDCPGDADDASDDGVHGKYRFVNGCLIQWKSQLQKSVSLSTAEAEYMSLCAACTECIWLIRMIKELGFQIEDRVIIRCDSKSAIHIAQNPVHCKYSKHIDTRDVFTKPLGKAKFREF